MDVEELHPDPHAQFDAWIAEASAAGVPTPEQMALATATPTAVPSVRMVLPALTPDSSDLLTRVPQVMGSPPRFVAEP